MRKKIQILLLLLSFVLFLASCSDVPDKPAELAKAYVTAIEKRDCGWISRYATTDTSKRGSVQKNCEADLAKSTKSPAAKIEIEKDETIDTSSSIKVKITREDKSEDSKSVSLYRIGKLWMISDSGLDRLTNDK
jgi:hypothetical protein